MTLTIYKISRLVKGRTYLSLIGSLRAIDSCVYNDENLYNRDKDLAWIINVCT